jgi:hypothetical protein
LRLVQEYSCVNESVDITCRGDTMHIRILKKESEVNKPRVSGKLIHAEECAGVVCAFCHKISIKFRSDLLHHTASCDHCGTPIALSSDDHAHLDQCTKPK